MQDEIVDLSRIKAGDRLQGVACLARRDVRSTKKGQPYFVVELASNSGRIESKVWATPVETFRTVQELRVGAAVHVSGVVDEGFGGGGLELSLISIRLIDSPHPVQECLNPICPTPLSSLRARFEALCCSIARPGLQQMVQVLLETVGRDRYERSPAALGHHHNYVHGLLEHSVEVAEVAVAIRRRPGFSAIIDSDIVLVGALLHDIGKVEEYTGGGGEPIGISTIGRLLPHTVLGPLLLSRAVSPTWDELKAKGLTKSEYMHVAHIMAAHHGTLEWGSPITPRTPEAQIIHVADLASARARSMCDALLAGTPDSEGWVEPKWPQKFPLLWSAGRDRAQAKPDDSEGEDGEAEVAA